MKIKQTIKAAFPHTIPVLTGYVFLGMAFGILAQSKGYHFGWAVLMSLVVYAGSMQFVAIGLLTSGAGLLASALMTLMVNARHMFYGLSMLEPFRNMGAKKPYMVFALTDETFSLLCSTNPPEGVEKNSFYFWITLLDHSYWVLGTIIGSLLGAAIPFNAEGIEFVMTALFIVIFLEQWMPIRNRIPALVGLIGSVACLLVFGAAGFIVPSMVLLALALTALRRPIESGWEQ